MQFADINKKSKIYGIEELPGNSNYFIGNNRARWKTNISQYAKIKQEEIYPGIDVIYYGNQNKLEYDLLVEPNADPQNISLKIDGIKESFLDKNGNLVLQTGTGDLILSKPVAYQTIDGQRQSVESRYVIIEKNKIGFEIGEYDKNQPLTIDPIIDYSTYIGGTSDDYIKDIAVDSNGNVYATGYTYSTNFPTKTGSY